MSDVDTLRVLRRRLCMLRMGLFGAVAQVPQAAVQLGLAIGEVEDLIAVSQDALNRLNQPGMHIPSAGLLEEGPGADDAVN